MSIFEQDHTDLIINPATNLPMTNGNYGGVDYGGSPYGFNINSNYDSWSQPDVEWLNSD